MKKLLIIGASLCLLLGIILVIIDLLVVIPYKKKIVSIDNINDKYDCIIVLGAGIWGGKPSPMLRDRLKVASMLYEKGVSDKIIVSGDHSKIDYDEVNVMKKYLKEEYNIPSEAIYMDHAGISTYDSMYRAKNVFAVKKAIIVTQEYHLYRALYLSDKLDINVVGVSASLEDYQGQFKREVREFLARIKDYFKGIILPKAKYTNDYIPVGSFDGDVTNDK